MTALQDDGMYIIDAGALLYVYIGRDVPNEETQNIKNTLIDPQGHSDTQFGRLLWQLRMFSSVGPGTELGGPMVHSMRPTAAAVVVVAQRDGMESRSYQDMGYHLINDAAPHCKSMSNFVQDMQQQVSVKLQQNRI
eukprot:CAMPEP_0198117074 /NCGR_PEP_ID=MMETSP1442-20131203/16358_1 /TAXON_ID= /ORGANISM="Craspedostauros australis, Strain CCMP3328" /LENGTH=135 /DNA_ID=CAMNT_0043775041 /DNA_START=174 /DNA_END=581 /DNA_ORIENTATION=-